MEARAVLVLPLPPEELNPNAANPFSPGARWFRIRAKKDYRRMVWGLAREYLDQHPNFRPDWRQRLTESYRIAGRRRRDVRNLFAAFKAGEDGLVDAGFLLGDDDSVLQHGAPRIERVQSKKEQGVVVEIENLVAQESTP